MTTTDQHHDLAVRFYLYGWRHLPLASAAQRLSRVVDVVFEHRAGSFRGAYYRWSADDGGDLLIQENVADEEGVLVERAHPEHSALVYATGLDDRVYEALEQVDGLELLQAEVVHVA